MNIDKKNLSIQILALIGLGLSINLAFIFYSANYNDLALPSFCSINEFIDCDAAAKKSVALFLGIPLAYWGIFFYITILFLTCVDKLKNIKFLGFLNVFKNPNAYIAFLGTIAFIVSMILAGISVFVIHVLCILCVVTYFIDLVIACVASDGMFKNIVLAFKTTFVDFINGAKKYPKTLVVLLLITASFLAFTGITQTFVPPKIKKSKDLQKYGKIKYNPYRVKGNILGDEDAKVVVELYSDYVCQFCYINNIVIHKAAKELKGIKVIHHNFPFDKACNPYINVNAHPNACFMSRGAIAAGYQGNYWEMNSLLYENRPKKMEEMLKLIEQLGLDKDKFLQDFQSAEISKAISTEIKNAEKLGIDSTPTMVINGEKIVGLTPYYELKEILIKHGATKR